MQQMYDAVPKVSIYIYNVKFPKNTKRSSRMKKREKQTEFVNLLKSALETEKIRPARVAEISGKHRSSISRILACEVGVDKPDVLMLVRAVNTVAEKPVLDEIKALEAAGFAADDLSGATYPLGAGASVVLSLDYSETERAEILEILKIAYEIGVRKAAKGTR